MKIELIAVILVTFNLAMIVYLFGFFRKTHFTIIHNGRLSQEAVQRIQEIIREEMAPMQNPEPTRARISFLLREFKDRLDKGVERDLVLLLESETIRRSDANWVLGLYIQMTRS